MDRSKGQEVSEAGRRNGGWGSRQKNFKRMLWKWSHDNDKRLIRNDNVVRRDAPSQKHSIHTSSNVSIAGGLVGSSGHLQSLCCCKVLISSLLVLRAVIL